MKNFFLHCLIIFTMPILFSGCDLTSISANKKASNIKVNSTEVTKKPFKPYKKPKPETPAPDPLPEIRIEFKNEIFKKFNNTVSMRYAEVLQVDDKNKTSGGYWYTIYLTDTQYKTNDAFSGSYNTGPTVNLIGIKLKTANVNENEPIPLGNYEMGNCSSRQLPVLCFVDYTKNNKFAENGWIHGNIDYDYPSGSVRITQSDTRSIMGIIDVRSRRMSFQGSFYGVLR